MTRDHSAKPAEGVEALLPCPFCGAAPVIGPWKNPIDQSDTCPTAIECGSGLDDCRVNPSVCDFSRDEAIAAWNRRTLAASRGEAMAWLCEWTDPDDGEVVRVSFEYRRGAENRAEEVGGDARVVPLYTTPTPDARVRKLVEAVATQVAGAADANVKTNTLSGALNAALLLEWSEKLAAALAAMDQERE